MSRILCIAMALVCSLLVGTSRASAAEARLNYQQDGLLKDATYYLDQTTGIIKQIDEKSKDWKVGDASVQIQDVNNLMSNMDRVKQYLSNAGDRFKQLPAEHSKVKPEAERLAKVQKSYDTTRTKLEDIQKGLKGIVEKGSGAGYKADFDRLREINQMFGNPQIFNTNPPAAIEIAKQVAPVKAERQRIATKYADLLKQSTGEAQQMNGVLQYFDQQFGAFEKAANQYSAEAPEAINQAIDENVKTAREAAAEKKLGFFGPHGGIKSTFDQTEVRYNVLAALQPDSPQTAAARKKIDDGHAQVTQISATLNDELLATARVPDDQYNGPDKQQILDVIKAKWAKSGLTGDVLKIGINSSDWKRDVYWKFNGTDSFYKTDLSKSQGYVVIKTDNKIATIYYINLTKDHLNNDKIEAFYFDDPKKEPEVTRKLLLTNVK